MLGKRIEGLDLALIDNLVANGGGVEVVGKEEGACFWLEPVTILVSVLPETPPHPPNLGTIRYSYLYVLARDGPCCNNNY